MGSNHLYSLSWGEFGSSLASAAQLLRGHGELVDVTLAAGGRSFAAHKIVLCAASPFLLDLLKSTPCQHPVIMLAGIGAEDLESLLEFVYRGEISVEPSQLPSLLQAAHCLNIHGLTPPTVLTENGEEIPLSAIPAASEALARDVINSYLPLRRRKRRTKSSSSSCKWPRTDDNHDTENRPLEAHNQDSRTTMEYERSKHDESGGNHGDESGDGNSKARSMSDQPATCPLCGAILRQSRNLRRHLELLHFGNGKPSKGSVRVKHRKNERTDDLHRASQILLNNREPHATAADLSSMTSSRDHPNMRLTESSDMQTVTPLSMVSSTASVSSVSNLSLPGNIMVPGSVAGSGEQPCLSGSIPVSSCTGPMGPPNNGIYSSDGTAGMLSCLLPPLPSLPSLPSSHDVFRHGEMLRAGVTYYDTSRQQSRHIHRADILWKCCLMRDLRTFNKNLNMFMVNNLHNVQVWKMN
ncbi:broad-complex core protein isoforms 1/2/3/4/5-like isoform X1 [Neodiprion fabricii]|uniref:broad-complex core protein isoforms 1/2/3/4/5-like isoform X1 n=1 Tax=Neodiprion fabricii TaxID=2872261 RepID=UPI001ED96052|nr:broad-complex core protein isoforms 1/2/3/4/5-like isoform X1 [Neodiprion fabricii]